MKKENKGAVKFFAMMFLSACVGGVFGFLSSMYNQSLSRLATRAIDSLAYVGMAGVYLMHIPFVMSIVLYNRAKKAASAAGEDELEDVENMLEKALVYSSYFSIGEMVSFGMMCCRMLDIVESGYFVPFGGAVVLFTAGLITTVLLQNATIKLTKQINPEKRGSVFEKNFQKDWYDSCDERERAAIGYAAYKSYLATTKAFTWSFLALVVLSLVYPIGPAPMLLVGVIWLVQSVTYTKYCVEKKKKN